MVVEPSNRPAALQLLRDGAPLPTREVASEEGGTTQVAVLEGVEAGSSGSLRVCGDMGGRWLGLGATCWLLVHAVPW